MKLLTLLSEQADRKSLLAMQQELLDKLDDSFTVEIRMPVEARGTDPNWDGLTSQTQPCLEIGHANTDTKEKLYQLNANRWTLIRPRNNIEIDARAPKQIASLVKRLKATFD